MTTTPPDAPVTTRRLDIRIATSGRDLIDQRAAAADVTRSHYVRRLLAYAGQHMPAGYSPSRSNRPKDAKLRVCIPARAHDFIARRATATDVKPAHMARRMLAYAITHMPADWLPGRPTRTTR